MRVAAEQVEHHAFAFRGFAGMVRRPDPALKAYLEGEQLLRSGRFEAAAAAFEQSVALDTAFALANYGLASARWWADRDEQAREPAARALRHAGTPPRGARMELEGQLARLDGDFDRAERPSQASAAHTSKLTATQKLRGWSANGRSHRSTAAVVSLASVHTISGRASARSRSRKMTPVGLRTTAQSGCASRWGPALRKLVSRAPEGRWGRWRERARPGPGRPDRSTI